MFERFSRGTRIAIAFLTLASTPCWIVPSAGAQSYPAKTVRIVVAYPPGGSNDVLARILAQKLSQSLGQQVIVDNRAGASGAIGADHVAKSSPDGYTLKVNSSSFAASAATTKLPFNTARDFTAIAAVGFGPMVVLVHPQMPVSNIKELLALVKRRPGELNYSSSGTGGINHVTTELFRIMAGINIVHVPYKGMAPAITDLIGGQVQLLITTFPSAGGMIKSGRLKPLAVTSAKRSKFAPELATVAESGVPGFDVELWWGFFGPAGMPRAVLERLNAETVKAVQTADFRERVEREGAEPRPTTPEQFNKVFLDEIAKWTRVAKEAKIQVE